jgi:hypothetical protein
VLELHHNRLGVGGAASALLQGLSTNETIENIDLEGNQLSNEDGELVLQLLTGSESICHVHVRAGNHISYKLDEQIEKKAKENYLTCHGDTDWSFALESKDEFGF